ncbi:MAG: SAM-dependent methyltransferase [Cyanobacteria bacterium P01_F01_bin.150]
MSTSSFLPIEDVADTAFLTAFYRAMESDRPDAHFHDPYARTLAGTRGKQAAQHMPDNHSAAASFAVRTCILDELILQTIEDHQVDVVISLGAGLDTRAYRLPLPPSIRWIEVDQPQVLTYKKNTLEAFQPVCHYQNISLDLANLAARRTMLRSITTQATRGLVITEGLLAYLTADQVAAIAQDLYETAKVQWWLTDLSAPIALQLIQMEVGQSQSHGGVKLQFAPAEGADFFRPYGWQMVEARSTFAEARRLKRSSLPEETFAQLSQQDWNTLCQMSRFIRLSRIDIA